MAERITRKLTTILASDAEQFSTAMNADEVGTYAALSSAREVFFKLIDRHGGRVANTAGDGLLADFPSVVEAVHCAIETQQELAATGSDLRFRIGIHLGDVICDGEDLIGEGVNLAARLQTMADPGGVLISQQVYDQVHAKLSVGFEFLGEKRPRNLPSDVPVYRLSIAQASPPTRRATAPPTPTVTTQVYTPSQSADLAADDPQTDVRDQKTVQLFGLVALGLLVLDLATGGGLWAQWPLLVLGMLVGFRAAPRVFGRDTFAYLPLRLWVLGAGLVLINLFSWSGYMWSLWPIGALGLLSLARRIMA